MGLIVPNIRRFSRTIRRMPGNMLTNIFRSRLFLFLIILVLMGILVFQYLPSSNGLNLVVEHPTIKRLPASLNLSRNVNLYKDELAKEDAHNLTVNVDLADQTISPMRYIVTESLDTCNKKVDVSFLKVHKAGSTTVMNIFIRFALSHKLNLVLPAKSSGFGFNYLGYGKTVSKENIVPLPKTEDHYNILCNHVVYNKNAFRSILPNDTVYVGILREPVSHFSSAGFYYGFVKALNDASVKISDFLSNPKKYNFGTYYVNNRMSFDLGIPTDRFHDNQFVDDYIQELDNDYSLMMIMEHFHESLVLLRRTLCWSTKDILYVPLNSRGQKTEFDLNEKDLENLRKWNSADFKLYNHFYNVFQRKIESQGDDFIQEVQSFKAIQESVKLYCLIERKKRGKGSDPFLTIEETNWSDGFLVTDEDCDLMIEHELNTMKRLIDQAWVKYKASLDG
ncbi:Galactose-3-O-sulfotransferase [Mactra antiquata]